jgi:WD40 repeat protein
MNSGHVLPISSEERFNILNVSENGMHLLICRDEELYYINSWEDGLGLLGFHKLDGIEERILEGLFDKTSYTEALFANDGESVVYADSHGKYFLKNLTTNQVTEFDSCKYIKHTNGYTPLLEISDNRIPRIINPVTGRFVDANFFDFKFSSPDGEWTVVEPDELALDNVGGLECVHKGTRHNLAVKEYNELRRKLDLSRFTSSASIGVRQERIKEMANHPHLFVDELNRRCSEWAAWKGAKINANVIRMYAINSFDVEDISRHALDCFVEYTPVFSKFLVDVTEFIEISNQASGQTRRINIGIPLWFMNYISFSYDSRYVAMAGRYEDYTEDENRNCLGGLYLLYDLIENKVVSKKTNSQAVWVTSFTKDGYIGFYDSHPTTYITNCANEEIIIGGRNFLTFSASGKYFALSNQGYVRYENATVGRPGGHQPSTNVYIRGISSPMEELAQYNDHGDKIKGVMTKKARTVAMVAFSSDDKRLLSISDDGVIVIRNLHL